MRARRPYLYSDTRPGVDYALTREVLASHLDSVTVRNDENAFERFARRLAEVEICPNLRPNTGPSGGGDGKVDSETYPVSPEIAVRWYSGDPGAASERWAFAISAKQDWKGKVRDDCKKIATTGRGYTRIYFITSRNARAKARADIEGELGKQYGIPVIILDQAWILERIFEHRRVPLAVTALGMTDSLQRQTAEIGPNDRKRTAELAALDAKIAEGDGAPSALAEDMLDAALLARGIERPRTEIDGRFLQARRLAKKAGNQLLEFKIVYNWAWTSVFWFDDLEALSDRYGDAAALIGGLNNAELISRLTNLWSLLRMAVSVGGLDEGRARLAERGAALQKMLSGVTRDEARPNSSLHARALQLFVEMINRRHDRPGEPMDDVWNGLREVLHSSEGFGTFPFEELVDSLSELGPYIGDSEAFDKLYSEMAELQAKRRGDGEAAGMLVDRGLQKLNQNDPYAAIRWFGQAIDRLIKKEFERELLRALGGLAVAYDKVGLWWAARMCALSVVSHQVTAGPILEGSLSALSSGILHGLFRMELSLARVGHAMLCHQLELIVAGAQGVQSPALEQKRHRNAMLVSALLVRTPFERRQDLTSLPDVLDQFALYEAGMPALFLLGRLPQLREEGSIPEGVTDQEVDNFIQQLWDAGPECGIENPPKLTLSDLCVMTTRILGVELTIITAPTAKGIQIGEALLGVIESFLSTSLGELSLPNTDHLIVRVREDAAHAGAPALRFENAGGVTEGVVTYSPASESSTKGGVAAFRDFCRQALVSIVGRLMGFADPEQWLRRLADDERAFDRALIFCNVPVMTDNVFGTPLPVPAALAEGKPRIYDNERSEPWRPAINEPERTAPVFGEGEAPVGAFDTSKMSHTAYRVRSPIDVQQWDRAHWNGSVFMYIEPPDENAPFLGLAFENREAAEDIFAGWHARIGTDDGTQHLRICIIRGVDQKDPNSYGVSIGPPMHFGDERQEERIFGYVVRINRMYPASSANLDGFLAAYAHTGRFLLVPFYLPDRRGRPTPILAEPIPMARLDVRAAWEIGDNDPDMMLLRPEDDPFIPKGVEDAPVLRALERIRRMDGAR